MLTARVEIVSSLLHHTKARVTSKPTQPTTQGDADRTRHMRLMEVEFAADDPAIAALQSLDALLEKFASTEITKNVKGTSIQTATSCAVDQQVAGQV